MDVSYTASVLASFFFTVSAFWYVYDVARMKITVSIVTYFMLTLVNTSQMIALVERGVWGVVPFATIGAVSSLLVCLLSLRNHKIYFTLLDKIGFVGAFIGFIVWIMTGDPSLNIYILGVVYILVFTPLVVKTFKHPRFESAPPWIINFIASFSLLCTVNSTQPAVWIVPVIQFSFSLLMNTAILTRSNKIKD